METKVFEAEIKESDDKDLTVTHFISTEVKDRGGDIVRADGMFMKGKPVVMLGHGYGNMGTEPVAKPLWIKPGMFKNRKGVMARTQFFPDEVGKRLHAKTVQGFMPNWSIGFSILEKKDIDGGAGREILKWELLEYSIVGVPMNPDAQTTSPKEARTEGLAFKIMGESQKPDICAVCGKEFDAIAEADAIIGYKHDCPLEGTEAVIYDEWEELFTPDTKPYPNEHACRVNSPDKYARMRRQNDKFGKGIHVIWGVLSDGKTEVQALRFSAGKFTAAEAKAWAKEHDYKCKPFEAATGGEDEKKPENDKFLEAMQRIDGLLAAQKKLEDSVKALSEALSKKPDEGGGKEGDQKTNPPACFVVVTGEEEKPKTLSVDLDELKNAIGGSVGNALKAGYRELTGKVD